MMGLVEADSSRPNSPLGGGFNRRESAAAAAAANANGGGDVKKAPQFSDKESLIWCRCCEGDLIVI